MENIFRPNWKCPVWSNFYLKISILLLAYQQLEGWPGMGATLTRAPSHIPAPTAPRPEAAWLLCVSARPMLNRPTMICTACNRSHRVTHFSTTGFQIRTFPSPQESILLWSVPTLRATSATLDCCSRGPGGWGRMVGAQCQWQQWSSTLTAAKINSFFF